ncbi:MAG TPA: winged helix-turn-helix domain-containing protein [Vicinamibacterales bacterium]
MQPKALALLGYFASHAGRLVSKRELLDALWPDVFVADAVLKSCVCEIRRALGDDAHTPRFVETAHRRGYRFIAPVREIRVAGAVPAVEPDRQIDIRHVLPTVRVPTLVLHRHGDRCRRVEEGRCVAQCIPDARFVELPGDDHLPFVGDADRLLDEIERFVRQSRRRPGGGRMLATILCATPSARLATTRHAMCDPLHDLMQTNAARFGGCSLDRTEVSVTALFDGPGRAIRCGHAIGGMAAAQGLPLRIGVHTGECDLVAGVAHGLAAQISSRIARLAQPGEVLVSRTVVDLVAGSGLHFSDRGAYRLADGLYKWHVFAVQDETSKDRIVAAPPAMGGRRPTRESMTTHAS